MDCATQSSTKDSHRTRKIIDFLQVNSSPLACALQRSSLSLSCFAVRDVLNRALKTAHHCSASKRACCLRAYQRYYEIFGVWWSGWLHSSRCVCTCVILPGSNDWPWDQQKGPAHTWNLHTEWIYSAVLRTLCLIFDTAYDSSRSYLSLQTRQDFLVPKLAPLSHIKW